MTQEHFMFYVQYLINIWNERKKKMFDAKLQIALDGSM